MPPMRRRSASVVASLSSPRTVFRSRSINGVCRLNTSASRNSYKHHHQHRFNHQALSSLRYFASSSGDDNYDEEWIPPDDSPLRRNRENYSNSAEEIVEVIDLEATLNNKSNTQLLNDDPSVNHQKAEYEVQATNVDWDDILIEVKDSGEEELLDRLVEEYNLQDRLAALNDTDQRKQQTDKVVDETANENEDEDEDWYDEHAFENLSDEEIIDELIENSPSLSQLELEILSQEMKDSDDEDVNLSDNIHYQEFRAMVLDDYYQKRQKRKNDVSSETTISESPTLQQQQQQQGLTAGEQFEPSKYPHNWTDYDSKQAFQRDFLQGEDDSNSKWIPPSSDFFPSSSYEEKQPDDSSNFDDTIDWLEARRSRLNQSEESKGRSQLMTPNEADAFRHKKSQIDVIPYTLFTSAELSSSLSAQGATDIRIIDVADYEDLYGVGMGCSHLMVATGRNSSHLRVLADSIVRNLKARKLNERGVVGALSGVEGGTDIFSNKKSRARASKNGITNTSARIDDDWCVVDCGNIHVHILEQNTRDCLDIESLWDLSNPNSEGSKLRRVDCENEDEVDTYVAENPVPEEYTARMRNEAGGGGWMTGDAGGRMIIPGLYNRKSFSSKWRGKSKGQRRR